MKRKRKAKDCVIVANLGMSDLQLDGKRLKHCDEIRQLATGPGGNRDEMTLEAAAGAIRTLMDDREFRRRLTTPILENLVDAAGEDGPVRRLLMVYTDQPDPKHAMDDTLHIRDILSELFTERQPDLKIEFVPYMESPIARDHAFDFFSRLFRDLKGEVHSGTGIMLSDTQGTRQMSDAATAALRLSGLRPSDYRIVEVVQHDNLVRNSSKVALHDAATVFDSVRATLTDCRFRQAADILAPHRIDAFRPHFRLCQALGQLEQLAYRHQEPVSASDGSTSSDLLDRAFESTLGILRSLRNESDWVRQPVKLDGDRDQRFRAFGAALREAYLLSLRVAHVQKNPAVFLNLYAASCEKILQMAGSVRTSFNLLAKVNYKDAPAPIQKLDRSRGPKSKVTLDLIERFLQKKSDPVVKMLKGHRKLKVLRNRSFFTHGFDVPDFDEMIGKIGSRPGLPSATVEGLIERLRKAFDHVLGPDASAGELLPHPREIANALSASMRDGAAQLLGRHQGPARP